MVVTINFYSEGNSDGNHDIRKPWGESGAPDGGGQAFVNTLATDTRIADAVFWINKGSVKSFMLGNPAIIRKTLTMMLFVISVERRHSGP